ncbi:hypothetical protein M0R72_12865 [Candidatus Pacearchaeota archaeon]|jgi:hypothetical protein|nr:hypothetical protein [Candidatus Pacearchaeota archaeon]
MNNIVLPVPDNYEVESVTITFKRPPIIKSELKPAPSRRAKKEEKHLWSDEDIAYLIRNEGTFQEQAAHLGVSMPALYTKRFALKEKGLLKDGAEDAGAKTVESDIDAALTRKEAEFIDGRISGSWNSAMPQDKISFFDSIKQKFQGFQAPADFDPKKPFGIKSYVYLAAGRKIGRVITIDQGRDLVTVDFSDQTLQFTVDGARSMHKEMIARAK